MTRRLEWTLTVALVTALGLGLATIILGPAWIGLLATLQVGVLTLAVWWLYLERQQDVERDQLNNLAMRASFWRGVKAARAEDIMAVEAVMTAMPDYARHSLKHMAVVIHVLRRLEQQDEQRRVSDAGHAAAASNGTGDAGAADQGQAARTEADRTGDRGRTSTEGRASRRVQRPDQGASEAAA